MAKPKGNVTVSVKTMEQITTLLKAVNVVTDVLKKKIERLEKRVELLEDCFRDGKDH